MDGRPAGGRPLPAALLWLAYAGVLPFAVLAGSIMLSADTAHRAWLLRALLAYSATILAFLGGIHWGALLAREPRSAKLSTLAAATLPPLVGALSLVLPSADGLGVQIVAYSMLWLYEQRLGSAGILSAEYLGLRRWLTLLVLALLVATLMGPGGPPSG